MWDMANAVSVRETYTLYVDNIFILALAKYWNCTIFNLASKEIRCGLTYENLTPFCLT